jgi:hypothetical protein
MAGRLIVDQVREQVKQIGQQLIEELRFSAGTGTYRHFWLLQAVENGSLLKTTLPDRMSKCRDKIAGVRRKLPKHCFGPPNAAAMDGEGRALSEAGCRT